MSLLRPVSGGHMTNYFQNSPGADIEVATVKTIGSLCLLKPFVEALKIREIVDRIILMERYSDGITSFFNFCYIPQGSIAEHA